MLKHLRIEALRHARGVVRASFSREDAQTNDSHCVLLSTTASRYMRKLFLVKLVVAVPSQHQALHEWFVLYECHYFRVSAARLIRVNSFRSKTGVCMSTSLKLFITRTCLFLPRFLIALDFALDSV